MSDEEIINLWKQGLSIEKITNRIVKLENIKDEPDRKKKYNRVEMVILNFYKKWDRYYIFR